MVGAVDFRLRSLGRGEQCVHVFDALIDAGPVHGLHVPAVRGVAAGGVFAE
jgi:hypothetical protein